MKRNPSILILSLCLLNIYCSKKNSSPPPVTSFTITSTNDVVPAKIKLQNNTTGALTWHWDFGNGETSIDENPEFIFFTAGTYEITLTSSNTNGTTVSKKTIVIDPAYTQCRIISVKITHIAATDNGYTWDFDGSTPDIYFRFLNNSGSLIYEAPTYYDNPQSLPLAWTLTAPLTISPLTTLRQFELLDYDSGFEPDIMGELSFAPSLAQANLDDPYPLNWPLTYGGISIELGLQWQ